MLLSHAICLAIFVGSDKAIENIKPILDNSFTDIFKSILDSNYNAVFFEGHRNIYSQSCYQLLAKNSLNFEIKIHRESLLTSRISVIYHCLLQFEDVRS